MARRSYGRRTVRSRAPVSRARRTTRGYSVGKRRAGRSGRNYPQQAVKLVIQMDNSPAVAADPFKVAVPAPKTAKF